MGSPTKSVLENLNSIEAGLISKSNLRVCDRSDSEEENVEQPPDDSPILNSPHDDKDGKESEDACEWVDDGNDDEDERISLRLIGTLWSEHMLNPQCFHDYNQECVGDAIWCRCQHDWEKS